MKNVIIPIVSEEMIAFANEMLKRKDLRVLIGSNKKFESAIVVPKDFSGEIKFFDDRSSKEEIINALNLYSDEGSVLICRKTITSDEVDKFFASESDITICKEKRNKFKNFFFKLWQHFIKLLFGFNFFDGDVSVVCFNERLFPVISNLKNISYSSRVNKWKYVNISQVETSSGPAKKEYNKTRSIATIFVWIWLILAVAVSTVIFFLYFSPKFLTCLMFACALLLAFVGLFISIAIHTLNVRTGQRNFRKAKKIREV